MVSADDPEVIELTLEGVLPEGGVVQAALNGLTMTPEVDYALSVRGGRSVVTILVQRDSIEQGDTFVIDANLLG